VEGITKETTYSRSGAIENTVTSFYENPNHRQITKREQLLSDNTLLTEQFKYPYDFQSSTSPNVYNEMVARNIINPVIEQSTFNNTTTFVESVKNNYDFWSNSAWGGTAQNSQIFLHTTDSKLGDNATRTRNRFYSFDEKGNVGAFSKENDVIKSYIWGYNYSYPVAEVVGESYSDVMSILNQSIIQNPATDQALRDELQKIRQSFPAALVTTYTYSPLIGMTSQTDVRNRTTYYEYDGFGRLKLVRDPDGNIIKTFKYNYKQ
jgi:YD repeat-containing protein